MTTLQKLSLALILFAAGLQAGLHFFMTVGEIPAIRREPLSTFVTQWQAVDHLMAARMPIVANRTLALYLLAIAAFARNWRSGLFVALVAAFAMSAFEVVFTVTQQFRVNHAIQALDPQNLSSPASIEQLRQTTIAHFRLRALLSISAFLWLAFVSIFSFTTTPAHASSRTPLPIGASVGSRTP